MGRQKTDKTFVNLNKVGNSQTIDICDRWTLSTGPEGCPELEEVAATSAMEDMAPSDEDF